MKSIKFVSRLAMLLTATLITGCQNLPRVPQAVLDHRDTIPWRRDQVVGLAVARENEDGQYERLAFGSDGSLAVTAGSTAPGGMLVAPLLGWRLHGGRLFQCAADSSEIVEEMHLVSLSKHELVIRDSTGNALRYRVEH